MKKKIVKKNNKYYLKTETDKLLTVVMIIMFIMFSLFQLVRYKIGV